MAPAPTTVTGHAPVATLPVTCGQIRVLLVAYQAVDEVYGGTRLTWDGKNNRLTFHGEPEADGSVCTVDVSVTPASGMRATIHVAATTTVPRPLDSAERAALRAQMQRQATQESRDMIAHLMKQVAQGVGAGFADRPAPRDLGLAG